MKNELVPKTVTDVMTPKMIELSYNTYRQKRDFVKAFDLFLMETTLRGSMDHLLGPFCQRGVLDVGF